MASIKCNDCGKSINASASYCPHCGESQSECANSNISAAQAILYVGLFAFLFFIVLPITGFIFKAVALMAILSKIFGGS